MNFNFHENNNSYQNVNVKPFMEFMDFLRLAILLALKSQCFPKPRVIKIKICILKMHYRKLEGWNRTRIRPKILLISSSTKNLPMVIPWSNVLSGYDAKINMYSFVSHNDIGICERVSRNSDVFRRSRKKPVVWNGLLSSDSHTLALNVIHFFMIFKIERYSANV